MDVEATKRLIRATQSRIVINVGSPFVNLSVLTACIDTGAAYLDTAIHEDPAKVCEAPPWYANYEWKQRQACQRAGVTAVLGVGFDPGVVNAYARYALDTAFDRVESIDIIDINAGTAVEWARKAKIAIHARSTVITLFSFRHCISSSVRKEDH